MGRLQITHSKYSIKMQSCESSRRLHFLSTILFYLALTTHLGLEDAEDELKRLEDLQNARKELERTQGEKPVSQKMFKAI